MTSQIVSLDTLCLTDERFRISFYPSLGLMTESIKRTGLIHPPLVCRRDKKTVVVTGWKRISACRAAGLREIPVSFTMEEDDLRLFKTAFFENIAFRNLDVLETAEAVARLNGFGEKEQNIIKDIFPLLGVPSTYEYFDFYQELALLERAVKEELNRAGMSVSSLRLLLKFPDKDRKTLAELVSPLGKNKQIQLLEDLWESNDRDGKSVSDFFEKEQIRNILESGRFSSGKKAERLRLYLKKCRYPVYAEKEEDFMSCLKALRWPEDVSVQHEPFFEDGSFHVSFSSDNKESFIRIVRELERISRDKSLDRLFEE